MLGIRLMARIGLGLGLWIALAATAQAGTANTNLSVNIVQPSAVARSDGTWDGTASTGTSDAQLVLNSPVPNGGAVFIALLYESCYNPASQPGCVTAGGNLDQITVGNNVAYNSNGSVPWLGHWQDARYVGDGLGLTSAWVRNVTGNPTTVHIISTSGGLWYDGAIVTVFTGIPSSTALDGVNGGAFASGGPLGSCCGDGNLTSPSVTPTGSGDFLYGVGVCYGTGPSGAGAGWTLSNLSTNYFGKADEWQVYNATGAVGATFPASCSGTSAYVATVAVKLQ